MQMTHRETPISGCWPMVDLRNVKVPLKALRCAVGASCVARFGLLWPASASSGQKEPRSRQPVARRNQKVASPCSPFPHPLLMQMTHRETPISGYWPMVDLRNVKVPLKAHWFCGPALRGGSLLWPDSASCGQIRPPVARRNQQVANQISDSRS